MDRSLFLFISIILSTLTLVSSQLGTDCATDSDCFDHQTCNFGYCRCDVGYVKNKHHCFKSLQHSQVCYFPEQCQDFRMVCESRYGDELTRCHCDRYHEWSETIKQCIHARNITDIIKGLQEETKWGEEIALEAERVFFWLVIAGLGVVCIGLICVAVGFSYACCCREKRSRYDDTEKLRVQEVASMGSPEGSYIPIVTDITSPAGTSGLTAILPVS